MARQVGQIPLQRKRIGGLFPCESCGYRTATVQVTMPLGEGVTHRLCKRCDPSNG